MKPSRCFRLHAPVCVIQWTLINCFFHLSLDSPHQRGTAQVAQGGNWSIFSASANCFLIFLSVSRAALVLGCPFQQNKLSASDPTDHGPRLTSPNPTQTSSAKQLCFQVLPMWSNFQGAARLENATVGAHRMNCGQKSSLASGITKGVDHGSFSCEVVALPRFWPLKRPRGPCGAFGQWI